MWHCGAVVNELLARADKPGSTPVDALYCFFVPLLRTEVDLRDNILNYLNICVYIRIYVCVNKSVQLLQCSDIAYLAHNSAKTFSAEI